MRKLVYLTKDFTSLHFLWCYAGVTVGSSFFLLNAGGVNGSLNNLVSGLIVYLLPAGVFAGWISYRQKKAKTTVPFLFVIPLVAGLAISILTFGPEAFFAESLLAKWPVSEVICQVLLWFGVIVLAEVSYWGCGRLPRPPTVAIQNQIAMPGLENNEPKVKCRLKKRLVAIGVACAGLVVYTLLKWFLYDSGVSTIVLVGFTALVTLLIFLCIVPLVLIVRIFGATIKERLRERRRGNSESGK
jgi:hypothetical protein